MCVSVDWPMSVLFAYICVYVCVFVYDIKSKYHQKNKKNMCQASVKLMPCYIKHIKFLLVVRYQGSTCVDP